MQYHGVDDGLYGSLIVSIFSCKFCETFVLMNYFVNLYCILLLVYSVQ